MIALGAVADDLTGATDLALMLTAAGLRTVVAVGPDAARDPAARDAHAVVVALKSRTAPAADAVADSLAAVRELRRAGAQRIYVKYCSTFDSTPEGNIGPVVSAVLDEVDAPVTVVVPAFPANGRTVYQGHLFVGDRLLAESSMRHHPLTPMRDSDIVRLLAAQTTDRVGLVPLDVVRRGADAVRGAVDGLARAGTRLVVVDATADDDLATIAAGTGHLTVLTGGSALAAHLEPPADVERASSTPSVTLFGSDAGQMAWSTPRGGPRVVLAGSASAATRRQVRAGVAAGRGVRLRVDRSAAGSTGDPTGADPTGEPADPDPTGEPTAAEHTIGHVIRLESVTDGVVGTPDTPDIDAFVDQLATTDGPLVVYTVADDADLGEADDAPLLEAAIGRIATRLVEHGVRRLIVAGGETSGAVIAALGVRTLTMSAPLSPGVAWARATRAGGDDVDLVLKSGNFGSDDLFVTAWDAAPGVEEGE